MTVRRNPIGPLRFCDLIKIEDVLFWNKTRPPRIEKRDDDSTYVIKATDRYDLLAHREIGDGALGHLIMERNDMRLWPNDFVPGRRIAIPTRDSLSERNLI